jgi:hypothetical protein
VTADPAITSLYALRRPARLDAHPHVEDDAALRHASHRVEVGFGHLGELAQQLGEPQD